MAFHLATASAAALTAAGSYAFIKTGSKASLIGSLGLGSVFLASGKNSRMYDRNRD
jgi:hypothetical protein